MPTFRLASVAAILTTALIAASALGSLPASAATASAPKTVTVLVTNDDGVAAPGIDALVQALRAVKRTKVVVVAPAANQTGAGGKTSTGPLATSHATTASGYRAIAVQGYPADTITAALDQLGVKPNLVMSGINNGQNLGTNVELSGTVGAARAAAARGIPAVALSQGFGTPPQYASAAKLAVRWLAAHRAQLARKPKSPPTTITNVNVPNCDSGSPRGVKVVSTATTADGSLTTTVDCSAPVTTPITTDIDAFNGGWASEAPVPLR